MPRVSDSAGFYKDYLPTFKGKAFACFPLVGFGFFFTLSFKFQTSLKTEKIQVIYLFCNHFIPTKCETISRYFPDALLMLGNLFCHF